MKHRIVTISLTVLLAPVMALSAEIVLTVGGSVGAFRTDMRLFNPSYTKDIQVQAYLLPAGNIDNASVQPRTITVPKRQMLVYDDVVASLFNATGLAAIRLRSDDDFAATQRIYAQVGSGTLGQFVRGLDTRTAQRQAVLLQLKANTAFRTNIGAVNPSANAANVTWRVYDRTNALVGTARTDTMPPYAVIAPQNMTAYLNTGSADLSDGWVSFTSDQPIFAYASVVDNQTTDPTFIEMLEDTGQTFQTDWNAFVDGIEACFLTSACRSQTNLNICSCVTNAYERQTVTWQGVYQGVASTSSDAVTIRMTDRTLTPPRGSTRITVANPILLQSLSASQLAAWNQVQVGTTVRFRTTIGIIRLIGTGFAGSGPPVLIFTTSGGDRLQ